ncbi:hypothetical protein D3C83_62700 [compost metagenome]
MYTTSEPVGRNAAETATAPFNRPPGSLRRSSTMPFIGPWFSLKCFSIERASVSPVCSWNWLTRK